MSITTKTFSRNLSAFVRSQSAMRDKAHAFILFGMTQASTSGDLGYLTRFMNACIGVRTLPTQAIKTYIQDHSNIVWSKLKDDSYGFKTKAGEKLHIRTPTVTWYDYKANEQAKPDMDIAVQIRALITRARKAMEEGKTKGEEADNNKLVDSLAALVA